jgi:predicted nuclease of predicted toxin-antitoxin system
MRIKLDENMPADAAALLAEAGHHVCGVAEEGLTGAPDSDILHASHSEGRILLTYDTDFADIRRYPPGTHAGIVVFRVRDQRWRSLQRSLRRLLLRGVLDQLGQGLAIVDEARVRYRRGTRTRRQ